MSNRDMVKEVANTFKCVNAVEGGKCMNDFQDDRYGKGMRVFTTVAEKTVGGTKRCTVCNTMAA